MPVNNSTNSEERDINDIFDDILLIEETLTDESYVDGFTDGEKAGNPDGYHLGYHRGAELGAELGYYYGIAEVFLKFSKSEKAIKVLQQLHVALLSFPRTNDETVDIFELANTIRAQFKKACALLKINGRYPEANELNF